jgi:hypothetical protein
VQWQGEKILAPARNLTLVVILTELPWLITWRRRQKINVIYIFLLFRNPPIPKKFLFLTAWSCQNNYTSK